MSINLVIADDEYFIRQRIKKIIPWEELGLTFVGEAENGEEVLNCLKANAVDILLLDIKMPKMTGLEVAKFISIHYPSLKIIILSGYNDFEYARSAMRYGAADYLLKPVDRNSLIESLQKCMEKITLLRVQEKKLEQYDHIEKCMDITSVLNGVMNKEALFSKYPSMANYSFSTFIGLFMNEKHKESITRLITLLRSNGLECEYLKETDSSYLIHLLIPTRSILIPLKELLQHFLGEQAPYTFITISPPCSPDEDWSAAYRQTIYNMNYRYFHIQSYLYENPPAVTSTNSHSDISKIRQRILFFLNAKDEDAFKKYLDEVFQQIETQKDVHYLVLVVTEIFFTYHIHSLNTIPPHSKIAEFASVIIDEEYRLVNLKFSIAAYGVQCMSHMDSTPSDVNLSNKLAAYIQEHYKDPELSVMKLSEVFQLNASYMGSLFKKVHNCSILQYLTKVRLEASQVLLSKNQYKISDIAEMVGYSDIFYYSKRFKKYYGYSPKDFVQRNPF